MSTVRSFAIGVSVLSCAIPGLAFAGSSTAAGIQGFRIGRVEGTVNCSATIQLDGAFSNEGPDTITGTLERDTFGFGNISLDLADWPAGAYTNFLSPTTDGGTLLTYTLDVSYDAVGCGASTGMDINLLVYNRETPPGAPEPVLLAAPVGTSFAATYMSGLYLTVGNNADLIGSPFALDETPGLQGPIQLAYGVWFDPASPPGFYRMEGLFTGTVQY